MSTATAIDPRTHVGKVALAFRLLYDRVQVQTVIGGLGIIREPLGANTDVNSDDYKKVDAVFQKNVAELKAAGAILIVVGLLILGNNLGLLWWVEPAYLLPLILVGAGAWLLFGRGRRG